MIEDNIYVGIDLSLSSPGLSIYVFNTKQTYAYFYPTRKKDVDRSLILDCSWNEGTGFHLCPFKEVEKSDLLDRYHRITTDIMDKINQHSSCASNTNIRMEGYAFDARSSSSSKLHELGGILKYKLHVSGYVFEEIAPTRLKKWFTNTGRATKEDMNKHFISIGFPNLLGIFEMNKCKGVPNPVQDIIDACALMQSFQNNLNV
jgi:Holliday junction resolvasome RuvABC endonuclease subunit